MTEQLVVLPLIVEEGVVLRARFVQRVNARPLVLKAKCIAAIDV